MFYKKGLFFSDTARTFRQNSKPRKAKYLLNNYHFPGIQLGILIYHLVITTGIDIHLKDMKVKK